MLSESQCWCFWRPDICFYGFICVVHLEKRGFLQFCQTWKRMCLSEVLLQISATCLIRRGQKLFSFSVANDLARTDRLFLIISFGWAVLENQLYDILRNMNASANFGHRIGVSFRFLTVSKMKMFLSFWINFGVLPHWVVGAMTTCQLVFRCIWRDMPVHSLNAYKALMKWLSMNYLRLWSINLRQELLSSECDRPWANCVNSKRRQLLIIRAMCVLFVLG